MCPFKSVLCGRQRYEHDVVPTKSVLKACPTFSHYTDDDKTVRPPALKRKFDFLANRILISKEFCCDFYAKHTDFSSVVEFILGEEASVLNLPLHPNREVGIDPIIFCPFCCATFSLCEHFISDTGYDTFNRGTFGFNRQDVFVLQVFTATVWKHAVAAPDPRTPPHGKLTAILFKLLHDDTLRTIADSEHCQNSSNANDDAEYC